MASVKMKDSAFILALRIAGSTPMDGAAVIGALAWLWHESQEAGECEASGRQIAKWAMIKDKERARSFLLAAADEGLLKPFAQEQGSDPDDPLGTVYEIVGNQKHIAAIRNYKRAGEASAAARWGERPRPTEEAPQNHDAEQAPFDAVSPPDAPQAPRGGNGASEVTNVTKRVTNVTENVTSGNELYDFDTSFSSVQFSSSNNLDLHKNERSPNWRESPSPSDDAPPLPGMPDAAPVPRGTPPKRRKLPKDHSPIGCLPEFAAFHGSMRDALAEVSEARQREWLELFARDPQWLFAKLKALWDWKVKKGRAHKDEGAWYSQRLLEDWPAHLRLLDAGQTGPVSYKQQVAKSTVARIQERLQRIHDRNQQEGEDHEEK